MARGSAEKLSPVCAYVAERTGTSLSVQQVARLREVLARHLGSQTEEEYVLRLKTSEGADELAELMSAISVHKTDMFRDEVQLTAFSRHVLEPLVQRGRRPLHVWSAGCATGEEVATLLILMAEAGAHPGSSVLGTDISESALAQARGLTFLPSLLKRVPEALRRRYFSQEGRAYALDPELRARARFTRHNLMDVPYPLPAEGDGFDIIFCRNVLIYFTEAAFEQVVSALAERLRPGGMLVLSAAEPILKPHPLLETLKCDQAFFYVRRAEPRAEAALPRLHLASPPTPMPLPPPPSAPAPRPAPAPDPVPAPPEVGRGARPHPGELAATDPRAEATRAFERVLEWAAAGEGELLAEQELRKCLYLDPHFAQARYLLATLLEQQGLRADAASEYRRALSALNEGRSRQIPFFLNDERLKTACASALRRLGYP